MLIPQSPYISAYIWVTYPASLYPLDNAAAAGSYIKFRIRFHFSAPVSV